ncbi:MAG: TonB-dependent receptor, partial [Bacteroidota bacterium]
MRVFSFLLLGLCIGFQSLGQNVTLSGYVKDAQSGETLIGATVVIPELQTGTNSNAYGFYSLSIPPGSYKIRVSYLGYSPYEDSLELTQDLGMDLELGEVEVELEEVIISSQAADRNVTSLEMSVNQLNIQTIRKMPSLLGEVEIIRSIQLLPGVSTVGEGASGFNVRGGSIDQNLILLDEAPVYNSAHLFGFFSVFNPDAVKDVKLYKGGMPARYGGRLSSILDVRMKEGNNRRFEMNGGIGLIFSRLSIEAPIIKDKASFIIAGRRSYADILAQPFLNDEFEGSALNFYDLTAKANYQINDKNQIFVSGYFGRDNFRFGSVGGFEWGNQTGTFRWNHLFSQKLFANLTLYYSNYDYQINFEEEDEGDQNSFDWRAEISTYGVKPEFSLFVTPKNVIRFGGQAIVYEFEPGTAVGISEGEVSDISLDNKYAIESSVFIENELTLSNRFTMNYGLRFSHFNYTGEGIAYTYGDAPVGLRPSVVGEETFDQWESIETYSNFEPRFSFKYQLNEKSSIKGSFARTAQYIHLISNTTASVPIDVWTPSTNNIQPQTANQAAIGYFRNFSDNAYEFSLETYYKEMDNIVDYIDGADLVLNEFLEGEILPGTGRAYGLEAYLEKKKGDVTGWISYTL